MVRLRGERLRGDVHGPGVLAGAGGGPARAHDLLPPGRQRGEHAADVERPGCGFDVHRLPRLHDVAHGVRAADVDPVADGPRRGPGGERAVVDGDRRS